MRSVFLNYLSNIEVPLLQYNNLNVNKYDQRANLETTYQSLTIPTRAKETFLVMRHAKSRHRSPMACHYVTETTRFMSDRQEIDNARLFVQKSAES
jgi:hypothetical protein